METIMAMTTPKDGGPASEMTVRQEYKKAAIAGLCANERYMRSGADIGTVSNVAAKIADAAIAEDAEFAEMGAPPTTGG